MTITSAPAFPHPVNGDAGQCRLVCAPLPCAALHGVQGQRRVARVLPAGVPACVPPALRPLRWVPDGRGELHPLLPSAQVEAPALVSSRVARGGEGVSTAPAPAQLAPTVWEILVTSAGCEQHHRLLAALAEPCLALAHVLAGGTELSAGFVCLLPQHEWRHSQCS